MDKCKSISLSDVLLNDAYCENALYKEVGYLLSFDADRLLAGFYETAGLPVKGEGRYGGWETWLIGGHTLGHYLTACAQAYANAGVDKEDKVALYKMLVQLIDGLLVCQANTKGKEGFIFAGKILDMNNVEIQFDNVEKGRSNIINEAWVPWYTMHKILAGVVDVYKFTGYEGALKLARGIGDWSYNRIMSWDAETHNMVLSIEYGGMNDALYALYEVSGDEKYAVAAHMFDEDALFEKVLKGGKDVLNNKHANTTIPKFVGAVNRFMIMNGKSVGGETVDASKYLEDVKAFWQMVIDNHTYITGANSEWEHFGNDKVLDKERTNCNNETCNVYNMLKLSKLLFEATKDKKYADYYEKAYINSILSSQNPVNGMTTYFQPMASGYFKTYSEPFTKFWCCTGSGMENFTKLNDSLFFADSDSLYINMYFDSKVKCFDSVVEVSADLLKNEKVIVKISEANTANGAFNIKLRVPEWTENVPKVSINRIESDAAWAYEGGYINVSGPFKSGDVIEMSLPMKVRYEKLPDSDNVYGFTYGPYVLSADMGCEDMQITTTGVMVTIPANRIAESENIVIPDGVSAEEYLEHVNEHVKINYDDGLTCDNDLVNGHKFMFEGCDYIFSPHYLRFRERYGIYWHIVTKEENDEIVKAKSAVTENVIDTVQPGYGQYENDELHLMEDCGSQGVTNDGTYRYALKGGYFTYRMSVIAGVDNYLVFTLRKADNGKTLKVEVPGRTVYYETLSYSGESDTYKVRVTIPKDSTAKAESIMAYGRGYTIIPVKFSGFEGLESARVCDFIKTVQ